MKHISPSAAVSAAIDEAAIEAEYVMVIAEATEDPFIAQELRLTGHTMAYFCWLFSHRQEVPKPHNWKMIALEEYPNASREPFMEGSTLEEHLHALGLWVKEFWTSPEATQGAAH